MFNRVVLVDEKNNEIGTEDKLEAHKKGLLHRAFSIFIFNDKNEILLQKRAQSKYHSAGLWSNTCCSHPYNDKSINDYANLRLVQEMGIETNLKEVFSYLEIFSLIALKNFFACCGVKINREQTLALGDPGMILTKSRTNSVGEWFTTTKLEYWPWAVFSSSSILMFFVFSFFIVSYFFMFQ